MNALFDAVVSANGLNWLGRIVVCLSGLIILYHAGLMAFPALKSVLPGHHAGQKPTNRHR